MECTILRGRLTSCVYYMEDYSLCLCSIKPLDVRGQFLRKTTFIFKWEHYGSYYANFIRSDVLYFCDQYEYWHRIFMFMFNVIRFIHIGFDCFHHCLVVSSVVCLALIQLVFAHH